MNLNNGQGHRCTRFMLWSSTQRITVCSNQRLCITNVSNIHINVLRYTHKGMYENVWIIITNKQGRRKKATRIITTEMFEIFATVSKLSRTFLIRI